MLPRRYSVNHIHNFMEKYSLAILNFDKKQLSNSAKLPPQNKRVVICGGGVMGASVAYHLAVLGWGQETVLIEKNRVGGGTTWNTSGLVGVFKPSLAQVKLTRSSVDLYETLHSKGLQTGWKQCGSLNIARTKDRMTMFRRMKAQSV